MNRDLFIKQITPEEELRRFPYDDVTGKPPAVCGKLSIGIGRNLTDKPLSDKAIQFLLNEDIDEVLAGLDTHLPWWDRGSLMNDVRQRVLVDLAFNLGISGLLAFRKFLLAVQAAKWEDAKFELQQSRWARQVGDGPGGVFDRADRLEHMILTGLDPA